MELIGSQLKAIMKLRKITEESMAQELTSRGMPYTRVTISRKCNGTGGRTDEAVIRKIADILNIEVEVLTDEKAYTEYMNCVRECQDKVDNLNLDDGILTFIKLAKDCMDGKDKYKKFEYACNLSEDDGFFDKNGKDISDMGERFKLIEKLMKEDCVNLGTYRFFHMEPREGEAYSMYVFSVDKRINDAFCLAGHEITNIGPICVRGDKCNKKEVENKVREMILSHDTGSDILNEKLRRYINRTGIAYKIVSLDITHKLFLD